MPRDKAPIVHSFETVSSTQRVARDLLRAGEASVGHIVVANRQTAGRGRLGREWSSPPGGLYATFIVPNADLLALRAGVATARALESIGAAARLKWPNDLVVGERKLGGILIETDGAVARIGVGINMSASPVPGATSLSDLGVRADRDALACAIHGGLSERDSDAGTLSEYRARSATLGRHVRIDVSAGRTIEGRAVDMDALGRLLVETQTGVEAVACGDCLHGAVLPGEPN